MSDRPKRISAEELIGALDDPKVRQAVRIPGVTDWYEERIAALEQERNEWERKCKDALEDVGKQGGRATQAEQERNRLLEVIQKATDTANAGSPAFGWAMLYAELDRGRR